MRRPIVFVFMAGFAAVLAAVVVFSALKKRDKEVQRALAHTVEIVVAAHDLPIGAKLDHDAVKLARWSRDSVPPGAFTDPAAVAGSFTSAAFTPNEPLVQSKLFMGDKTAGVLPLLIPSGMRAMSVPVDEVSDVAGFVQPHARVDVLVAVSGTAQGESSFSRLVLQDIEVIAVAQEIEHHQDQPEVVRVVTLLVTPEEAEKLSLATREGTIKLAMRNYGDNRIVATNGISLAEMLHGNASQLPMVDRQIGAPTMKPPVYRGPEPLTVEIMRDGTSSEALSFIKSTDALSEKTNSRRAPGAGFRELPAEPSDSDSRESSASAPATAGHSVPSAFSLPPPTARPAAASFAPQALGITADQPGYKPIPKTIDIP